MAKSLLRDRPRSDRIEPAHARSQARANTAAGETGTLIALPLDPPAGSLPPTRPAIPILSDRLRQLLAPQRRIGCYSEDGDFLGSREEWRPAGISPADQADLQRQLALVDQALAPAERGRLLGRVFALLAHYRETAALPAAVEQAVAADWAEDLGEFPFWAVEEACRRWRRDPQKYRFRPLPGDIRRLCLEAIKNEETLRRRLRLLMARCDAAGTAGPVGAEPPTDRANAVAARVAALARQMRLP